MRPILIILLSAAIAGAGVALFIGVFYGSAGPVFQNTPPAPTPPPPAPVESGIVTWSAGDNVAGLTSSHPLSYNCSMVLFLPHQGSANRSLIEACYAANLTAITEASDLLCGIQAIATNVSTFLIVTCPANCSFAGDLAATMVDSAGCALDTDVGFYENSLVKLSGSQSPAPIQLDRINQRDLPLDDTFNWTYDGSGPVVFLFDTGIDTLHTDLAGKILSRVDLTFAGTVTGDCVGHGTAVASQIVGTYAGVSKAGAIVDVRVANCNGVTGMGSVLAALTMVGDGFASYARKIIAAPLDPLMDSITLTVMDTLTASHNVLVVASAGNDGLGTCPDSPPTNFFVGALDVPGNDTRAGFSHFGDCVQLAAPGVDNAAALKGTSATFANRSGTSYAAALVAGAAAMAWSAPQFEGLTAVQIHELLVDAATTGLPNTDFALLYTADFGTLPTPSPTAPTPTVASTHSPTAPTPTSATPTAPSPSPTHSSASATSASPTVASSTTASPTHASSTASPICVNYTSYIQGLWGQPCHTTDTSATPVGCLRDADFDAAFPSALVIGCPLTSSPTFRRLNFTTSYAISLFAPNLGAPAVLTVTSTNPLPSASGTGGALAGNLLGAKLNVGIDAYDPAFSQCPGALKDLCFASSVADCGTHTLENVIKAADLILGACNSMPICLAQFVDPADADLCLLSPTQMSACLAAANANYGNGNQASLGTLETCA